MVKLDDFLAMWKSCIIVKMTNTIVLLRGQNNACLADGSSCERLPRASIYTMKGAPFRERRITQQNIPPPPSPLPARQCGASPPAL